MGFAKVGLVTIVAAVRATASGAVLFTFAAAVGAVLLYGAQLRWTEMLTRLAPKA